MAASVTSRALDLLGAFDPEHRSLTMSELARRSGLPLATAHRLIGELRRWGALDRLPSGDYVIGRRLWDLGLLAPVQTGLRQAASPFLHDLYGATLATVHLAVRDGSEVLYVDRLSGHVSVPVRGADGSVVAALGIVVPDLRRERARLVSALQVAAGGIGRTLSVQWK